jgi:UDP-2,3-diacylglucosamine pyrophosphatase LpxH
MEFRNLLSVMKKFNKKDPNGILTVYYMTSNRKFSITNIKYSQFEENQVPDRTMFGKDRKVLLIEKGSNIIVVEYQRTESCNDISTFITLDNLEWYHYDGINNKLFKNGRTVVNGLLKSSDLNKKNGKSIISRNI